MQYLDNHFLFSETFIREYLQENNKNNNDVINTFRQIYQWNEEYIKGEYKDDHWYDFIDTVFDILGFKKRKNGQERFLYTNTITENEKPVAFCFIVERNINIASTAKGEYYAFNAINIAKKNGIEWAMLTNGYHWRIYNTKNISPYENYLEIDIGTVINNSQEPNEVFGLFHMFFNSTTYYNDGDELVIDKIKEKSDKTSERIEDCLRSKIEDILEELCYGLKEDINKEIYDENERKNIYKDAIILLYRLLFYGYAESRKMLPIVENDLDYTESFSKLCKEAKNIMNNGELNNYTGGYVFWHKLDNQLRIYVDNNYNGGLFNNVDKPIIGKYRIKDQYLIKCLAELSYIKARNGKYEEKIEYKDLSVRNLGAIYEGILEYQLFIAEERMVRRKSNGKVKYIRESETTLKNSDLGNIIEAGGIYLSQDATERKETGSYYTPEDVVEYIVENTVGKRLSELRKELQDNLKEHYIKLSYEPTEMGKRRIRLEIDEVTRKFIEERILNLSIIDSAMGSGHFLVNAAYRVANEIVEIVSENNWNTEIELPADIFYWKRRVVENCIYGIDINELAVTLARLSLWLISASNDKALSFIDHHLKVGDSIIGTDRTKVERIKHNDKMHIFDVSYEILIQPILNKYENIKKIGSKTKRDVELQKEVYQQIEEEIKLLKYKYDFCLASQYKDGIEDEMGYAEIMNASTLKVFENKNARELLSFAKENQFFHWELEFPEVFEKGGFDIAIGNPPYVEIDISKYMHVSLETLDTRNLFSLMIENSLKKCRGYFGFIIPISSFSSNRMISFQEFVKKKSSCLYISNYGTRPSKIFFKVEQRVSIIFGKVSNDLSVQKKVYTTSMQKWFSNERKDLFKNIIYIECIYKDIKSSTIPKIYNSLENSILRKIYSEKKSVKDYVNSKYNKEHSLYYHSSPGYWMKALDYIPEFYSSKKGKIKSSKYKPITLNNDVNKYVFIALINSSLFYWYWVIFSDGRDIMKKDIIEFPFDYSSMSPATTNKIEKLAIEYIDGLNENCFISKRNLGGNIGEVEFTIFKPKYNKEILDKIDERFGEYFCFTIEEIEFIKNYDYRLRIGDDEYNSEEDK